MNMKNDGWYTPDKKDFIYDLLEVLSYAGWIIFMIWFLYLVFT